MRGSSRESREDQAPGVRKGCRVRGGEVRKGVRGGF